MRRKVIVDSDTATDDTIAILLSSALFDLVGVSIVAGNVNFQDQVNNALFTLEYIGRDDVPVYIGYDRPILGQWRTVEEVHGKWGMSGWRVSPNRKKPEKEHAVDAILRLSKEYEGELEIMAISPLTNLAQAYLRDNGLTKRVKKVWIMGGAFTRGNTTPLAEFNFWVDPEAAKIVLNAGFEVTIVPWEVTEKYGVIYENEWEEIGKLGSRLSEFFVRSNKALLEFSKLQGNLGSVHPDSLTVYLAYNNQAILEERKLKVDIELCSLSRGGMLVDWYNREHNSIVVLKADRERFKTALLDVLSSF
ncbi:nucleoside hydrolase [Metallosphaera tengchongensis]|uniref:Nucleoside hydrolase n=1 Tax=Metallosphaera tengchongensis TaxID=1532350 RepID=A0A6N0NUL6_9CREN|nr:nucleoside hydrolase [Metallosphaera tengchongensis]QKR00422.1 nucleoside hydrolase [Metallosphaera tengchongensis]